MANRQSHEHCKKNAELMVFYITASTLITAVNYSHANTKRYDSVMPTSSTVHSLARASLRFFTIFLLCACQNHITL